MPLKIPKEAVVDRVVCRYHGTEHFADELCPDCAVEMADWTCREILDPPRFVILNARWTPQVNLYLLRCQMCEKEFEHQAGRWRVLCPKCGLREDLREVRKNFLFEKSKNL